MPKQTKRKSSQRAAHIDRDERFVLRLSATYLKRVLTRMSTIDQSTMEFIFWVVGRRQVNAISRFLESKSHGAPREKLKEEFRESNDEDDRASVVVRHLNRGARNLTVTFLSFVQQSLERRICSLGYQGKAMAEENYERFQQMFNLSDKETEFCFFIYLANWWPKIEQFFNSHLECFCPSGKKYLTTALNISSAELSILLQGKLSRLGVIEQGYRGFELSNEFAPLFQETAKEVLTQELFKPAPHPDLSLEHHLVDAKHTQHLIRLLGVRPQGQGRHILLYGPPGTGKTSYARGLVQRLGGPAYEVLPKEDNKRTSHRTAILACLNMTNHGAGSLVIVDEADNVLNTGTSWFSLFDGSTGGDQDKGWLNFLLERPGVRMIWICNRIDGIDESVKRRFAFSLPFRSFNRAQRIELWNTVARTHRVRRRLGEKDIISLSTEYKLNAGAIDLAVRTAKETCARTKKTNRVPKKKTKGGNKKTTGGAEEKTTGGAEEKTTGGTRDEFIWAVRAALDAHQTLLNDGQRSAAREPVARHFTLEALNTDVGLEQMIGRLEKIDRILRDSEAETQKSQLGRRGINIMMYGLPGTGKSELARYLAHHLDREAHTHRASDILSKWVGSTERNLAGAFRSAEQEEAVLILDEVDTFLYGRELAEHSWEVSFTNELLTQMERFNGILICTTNRLEGLDPAALRRFQVKIQFNYLNQAGKELLYRKLLAPLCAASPGPAVFGALGSIEPLAPGDFRVVLDQHQVDAPVIHGQLVNALRKEAYIRDSHQGGRPMGFAVA